MADWYISSAGYTAVTAWAATTAYSVGDIRRPTAATYGSERVYRCTTAGTSGGTEPSAAGGNPWNVNKNGTTADGTVVWTEVTGISTYNWSSPFARLATIQVQATGPSFALTITVLSGGTGYAVGNVLQLNGGTAHATTPAYVRVATLSASAVATVTVLSGGAYTSTTTLGSTSTAVTGTGTGATFNTPTTSNYAAASGDTFYISHDHAETQATAMSLAMPGSLAAHSRALCVDRTGSVPPVSADLRDTASIVTTGATNMTICTVSASGTYWQGLNFSCGTSGAPTLTVPNISGHHVFKNCRFELGTGTTGGSISHALFGVFKLFNVKYKFAHISQAILRQGPIMEWRDTPNAIEGVVPTNLLNTGGNTTTLLLVEGVDLSAAGSGKTLNPAGSQLNRVVFKDCKLGASVTVATGLQGPQNSVSLIRCDSGATNYRTEKYDFVGTLTTETTIVRTGGATDGTTPISWKIVTTGAAGPEWQMPFECFPIAIWNETIGSSVTVTVEGVWGGGAVPLNDEIWMDVEYLGDASYPTGSFVTTTKADILAAGTNTTASSETWGGSTTKFKLVASVTPQMKGPITVTVKVAKVSSTFYIDPKITLS